MTLPGEVSELERGRGGGLLEFYQALGLFGVRGGPGWGGVGAGVGGL